MPLPIQKFREALLQILYSSDFELEEGIIPFMMQELKTTRKEILKAFKQIEAIRDKLSEIDPLIASSSTEYRFERISRVERSILRLGLYELLFEKIPEKVAISEAVRLCRKFGTPESAQFVNAILDGIIQKHAQDSKREELLPALGMLNS